MNDIERLSDFVSESYPQYQVSIDEPTDPNGPWFLDLVSRRGTYRLVVEWRPGEGLGLSELPFDEPIMWLGEGPDEVYDNPDQVRERLHYLLHRADAARDQREPAAKVRNGRAHRLHAFSRPTNPEMLIPAFKRRASGSGRSREVSLSDEESEDEPHNRNT